MKRWVGVVAYACLVFSAGATNVGLLKGLSGHNAEWDEQFTQLDWNVSRFDCTVEGMKEFAANAASLDFVLVPPLFNWKREGKEEKWILPHDVDASGVREYVKNGGMIVVTEAQYKPCQEFFRHVAGEFSVLTGKCTSSPWVVLGHTSNVEPVHPLRCFPNAIVERDNWAHFELPEGSEWKAIAVCSEGKPTTIVREYGKGCVVFVAMRHNRLDALENYYAYAMARRYGVSVSRFEMPPFAAGDGRLVMELSEEPKDGASLTYELAGADGRKTSFSTNFVGKVATIDYNVSQRGKVASALYLTTPKGRVCLFTRTAEIAPLFAVKPNWYRGLLSTKRRVDTVDFKVEFAPNHETIAGAKVVLEVYDACSNLVCTSEHLMPTNEPVALEHWLPVPLSKKLGAGGYRIDAKTRLKDRVVKGRVTEPKSSAAFEILKPHPAQVMIDDDGTFLVNGVPYYPLGIYHCGPKDIPQIAEIGFNTMQFFAWHLGGWGDKPMLNGVGMADAYGIRCVFEGIDGQNEYWKRYLTRHPATFGYYIADEPCEGAEPRMEKGRKFWTAFDKDHPQYIDSCRPDLFHIHQGYCDILSSNGGGIDILTGPATMNGHKACCLTPGCERYEDPENPECYRATFYTGLAQNLRGQFWYCWAQEGGGPLGAGLKCQPKSQEVFKSMFAEAKVMFPGLLSTVRRPFVVTDKVRGMVCGKDEGNRFLILANDSKNPAEIEITVPELAKVKKVRVPFALPQVQKKNEKGEPVFDNKKNPVMIDQKIELEGGVVKHTFPAYGTLVYRW